MHRLLTLKSTLIWRLEKKRPIFWSARMNCFLRMKPFFLTSHSAKTCRIIRLIRDDRSCAERRCSRLRCLFSPVPGGGRRSGGGRLPLGVFADAAAEEDDDHDDDDAAMPLVCGEYVE